MEDEDLRILALRFVSKLTLCSDMGDVYGAIETFLPAIGFNDPWVDLEELQDILTDEGFKPL